MDQRASARIAVATMASALESSGSYRSACWISWILRNVNAVPADLTSMMMRRVFWLILWSLSFAFIVTAVAGPVVAGVSCVGLWLYGLGKGRAEMRRAQAEALEAEAVAEAEAAAAEAVVAEAEAVIAAARLRLLGGAGS